MSMGHNINSELTLEGRINCWLVTILREVGNVILELGRFWYLSCSQRQGLRHASLSEPFLLTNLGRMHRGPHTWVLHHMSLKSSEACVLLCKTEMV